jgi:Flp pilus assembly protein TadB
LTVLVILVIGLAWVAFLGPTIMRARNRQGRTDSVGDFSHRLTQLGRTNGPHGDRRSDRSSPLSLQRPLFAPSRSMRRMSAAQKRRRDVLFVLAGAVGVTFLLTVVTRSAPVFLLNLLADAALVAFVYLLIQIRQQSQEQRTKVRFLGSAYQRPAPYLLAGQDHFGSSESNGPRLVPLRQTASR